MARALLLLLLAACAWLGPRPARCPEAPQTPDWRMTLKTIRNGVHKIDVYLNAALDLLGGEDGLCQYKCSDGEGGGAGGWRRGRDPAGPRRPLPFLPPAAFGRPGPVRPAAAARAGGSAPAGPGSRSQGSGAQPGREPPSLRGGGCPARPPRPRLPQGGAGPGRGRLARLVTGAPGRARAGGCRRSSRWSRRDRAAPGWIGGTVC